MAQANELRRFTWTNAQVQYLINEAEVYLQNNERINWGVIVARWECAGPVPTALQASNKFQSCGVQAQVQAQPQQPNSNFIDNGVLHHFMDNQHQQNQMLLDLAILSSPDTKYHIRHRYHPYNIQPHNIPHAPLPNNHQHHDIPHRDPRDHPNNIPHHFHQHDHPQDVPQHYAYHQSALRNEPSQEHRDFFPNQQKSHNTQRALFEDDGAVNNHTNFEDYKHNINNNNYSQNNTTTTTTTSTPYVTQDDVVAAERSEDHKQRPAFAERDEHHKDETAYVEARVQTRLGEKPAGLEAVRIGDRQEVIHEREESLQHERMRPATQGHFSSILASLVTVEHTIAFEVNQTPVRLTLIRNELIFLEKILEQLDSFAAINATEQRERKTLVHRTLNLLRTCEVAIGKQSQ